MYQYNDLRLQKDNLTMDKMKYEVVTDLPSELGEGPVWDADAQRIIWVDIEKGNIHQYYPEESRQQTFHTGQRIGAVALKRSGGFIAALQHGFVTIDIEKQTIEIIDDPESHLPGNRFNDGKCDPAGRFWAGTMSMQGEEKAGGLYTLEKDLSVSKKISEVSCSNGMAWSSDHATFYFIDTPTRQVVAYDYNITDGSINNKRIIITISEEDGFPDGMTIDTEGLLWVALWGGWKIEQWDPHTGKRLQSITLPASQITSCTFGGKNLNDLYITSANTGLSANELKEQPLAGHLFVVKSCGSYGLPADTFDDI